MFHPNSDKPKPKRLTAKTAKNAKFFKGFLSDVSVLGGSKILVFCARTSFQRYYYETSDKIAVRSFTKNA
jgi:hypothetical protein